MPNLVAYNSGSIISNALQFGTIVMDVNNTVNLGSPFWCPDYGICNQYLIVTDSYTNGKTNQLTARAMGFQTSGLTNSDLIAGINKLASSKSAGPFGTLSDAINWAIYEGYFITNQEYPSIVTSGCVLNLDSNFPPSYPLVFNTWYDLTGNGNTGLLINGITYDSALRGSLVLNGTNQYVSFSATTGIPLGNSNYTISTWFNPSTTSGDRGLVGWGNFGTPNQVNALKITSSGLVNYWWANDLQANYSFTTGNWYNAVATFDGTIRSLWINGSLISSDTPVGHNVPYSTNLEIGVTNGIEFFGGNMGEVQIFDRSLSSSEITQNYNALLPRYNGTYTDPCDIAPLCTPTPTPTISSSSFLLSNGLDCLTACSLPINNLVWNTTVDNLCDPNPWTIYNNNLNIRYNIVDSVNCGGSCSTTQAGTATATITVGGVNTYLGLEFEGIGELEAANYELIKFYLDGVEVANGHAAGGNLECQMGPIVETVLVPGPYLLSANTSYEFFIDFTTNDPLYHVGGYYEVALSLSALTQSTYFSNCVSLISGCNLCTDSGLSIPVANGKYSNYINCYTVVGGVITDVTSCIDQTTTPTPTPTATPTGTPVSVTPTPTTTPCFGYGNCEYYGFTISALDVESSYNSTVYADYFPCDGEGAVTATYTFPGAGIYTDTICVYSFSIPTPDPFLYYYSSSPEVTKIPASNSSFEIGGFCCGITPTPTPTGTPSSVTPTPTPTPTSTLVPSLGCSGGTISGTYSGNEQYTYPSQPVSSSVDSYINFSWSSLDRPNRFTVYDSTGLLWTSGWVGFADYAGPWGASLNTPSTGNSNICFLSSSGRYVLVEAGNASPTTPITDAYNYTLTCLGSCPGGATPTPTATSTPTATPNLTCNNYNIEGAPSIDVEWLECDGTTNSDTVTTAIVVCAQTGSVTQTGGAGNIVQLSSCFAPTPTPTETPASTPTSTPTSTPAGIQATIQFSFFDSGSGVIRASMEVISGVTLDSLSWGGIGIGYSSLGCSGTENTQSFSDVLGIGNTQITTEVWGSISAILSAQNQTSSFAVNGNTINTVSQIITVGGHNYVINGVTDCFSPL